jgi:uncharacterized repeat protein (TIGR03987 family)
MLGPALHITLVLVFYSLGVWAEKISQYLKPWHVIAFWTGFLFDMLGTWMMHRLAFLANSLFWWNVYGNDQVALPVFNTPS